MNPLPPVIFTWSQCHPGSYHHYLFHHVFHSILNTLQAVQPHSSSCCGLPCGGELLSEYQKKTPTLSRVSRDSSQKALPKLSMNYILNAIHLLLSEDEGHLQLTAGPDPTDNLQIH